MHKLGIAAISMLALAPAFAADEAGTIKTSQGQVQIERGAQKLAATVGARVDVSDRISTGKDGSIGITLRDNTILSAGPNAVLELNKFAYNPSTQAGALDVNVKKGSLAAISGKVAKNNPDAVRFTTSAVTLGVRGTEFILDAGQGEE
jgi:hypothetical protein